MVGCICLAIFSFFPGSFAFSGSSQKPVRHPGHRLCSGGMNNPVLVQGSMLELSLILRNQLPNSIEEVLSAHFLIPVEGSYIDWLKPDTPDHPETSLVP